MFETVSVFDAMELDNTHRRVASRRALALAHNRVERNLGRFLRAAQSEEEFFERLALMQDEFEGYVTTASTEVGHDHPEHIAAALRDHYRLAADKVEFEKTPAEEQEEAEDNKTVSASQLTPKEAKKALKRMAKAGRTWKQAMPLSPEMHNNINQYGVGGVPANNGVADGSQMLQDRIGEPPCPQCGGRGCPYCPQGAQQQQPAGAFTSEGLVASSLEGKQGSPLGRQAGAEDAYAGGAGGYELPNLHGENSQGQYPIHPGDEAHHTCPQCGSMNHQTDPQTGNPQCLDCGYSGPPANPYGAYSPESDINHQQRDLGGYGGRDAKTADMYTGDGQRSHQLVSCPECGGDGKTAGAKDCPKCAGKGKVPNFPDSILDAYFGRTADDQGIPFPEDPGFPGGQGGRPNHVRILQEQGRPIPPPVDEYGRPIVNQGQEHPDPWMDNEPGAMTFPPEWSVPGGLSEGLRGPRDPDNPYRTADQNQNNTDLDGPEPKMDKRLWTPGNPGKPDYEDGPRHPTKEKDITEVIGPMRNEHEVEEIHGQGTHYKQETLPTNSGDAGFDGDGPGPAPHTKTFGDKGQTDPVTNETLEKVKGAYLSAINKEAMGMSAMDFRMLADALKTAPEGADKPTLANHMAQYLKHTNPMFDADRFLQAAIGEPMSGRDTYKGPGGPQDLSAMNADLNGPGGFGEQLGQGLGMTAKADDIHKNPLAELLQSEWPSEQAITAAFLQ